MKNKIKEYKKRNNSIFKYIKDFKSIQKIITKYIIF